MIAARGAIRPELAVSEKADFEAAEAARHPRKVPFNQPNAELKVDREEQRNY